MKIKTCLISVYHKDGLEDILSLLASNKVEIISTGGTYDFITKLGYRAKKIEEITNYPDLFSGRVKTLHPAIMGGLLCRRNNKNDLAQLHAYQIKLIDLVIVDLYPFEETLKNTTDESEIIEKIDIGGITLIRAAAKNYVDVLCVPSREYYGELIELLKQRKFEPTLEDKKRFATYAFKVTAKYETAIYNYFSGEPVFNFTLNKRTTLRYGENPHQKGYFYGNLDEIFEQLHGKELSYNNLQDIEACLDLLLEFEETSFVIVKHANPCGVASRNSTLEAWQSALSSDPLSAFGGIIATNSIIDEATAEKINEIFFEVLIAPDYTNEALNILKSKKNRIILKIKDYKKSDYFFRSCLNGALLQDNDKGKMNFSEWKVVTGETLSSDEIEELIFANKIVKHTKSNAIAITKNKMLLGSGMGQTSRVDAVRLAIMKAKQHQHNLEGAVLASDAFFPFADGVELAANEGIKLVIQPGGSIRDEEVIDYCKKNNIKLVFTGYRYFKH